MSNHERPWRPLNVRSRSTPAEFATTSAPNFLRPMAEPHASSSPQATEAAPSVTPPTSPAVRSSPQPPKAPAPASAPPVTVILDDTPIPSDRGTAPPPAAAAASGKESEREVLLAQLKDMFPTMPPVSLRRALSDSGNNLESAANALVCGHYAHTEASPLEQLQQIFPFHAREVLERALLELTHVDAAVSYIFSIGDGSPAAATAAAPAPPAATGSALAPAPAPVPAPTAPTPASIVSDPTRSTLPVPAAAPAAPRLSRNLSHGDKDFARDAISSIMPAASAERVEGILTTIVSSDSLSPLDMLASIYPDADRAVLARLLQRAEGSVDEAAADYQQSLDDAAIVADLVRKEKAEDDASRAAAAAAAAAAAEAPAPPFGFGFGAAPAMLGGWGAGDFTYHGEDDEEEDYEEHAEPEDYRFARIARGKASRRARVTAAARPVKRERVGVVLEDKPAQSLLCVPSLRDAETHMNASVGTDDLAPLVARCFGDMVRREQEHWGTHVCFYHSYSFAAIIYEVQAAVARGLYDLPMDFAPLPRLLKKPFDGRPTMDMLMEDFKRMPSQDHNAEFRAVAISVSCSMFGFGSEAPPLSCFRMGYSCTDLSFRGALEDVLKECGLERRLMDSVVDKVVEVSNKYGLMGNYGKKSGRRPGVFMPAARSSGHMLQIFVRKDVVDHIAYRSHPMGVPVKEPGLISEFLSGEGRGRARRMGDPSGPCNGQARVFMHPAIFTDPSASHIYHYCALDEYMNPDPSHPGSRGAYVQELHAALAPILGSAESLRRAYCGVEALRVDAATRP